MKRSRLHLLGILLTVLICAAIIPALAAPHFAVDDQYTVALLHLNGDDASNAITDESGKAWTAYNNAQIDTAQKVFGSASLLLDGSGDYIGSVDSPDWRLDGGSNSNSWTIDLRVRVASLPGDRLPVAFAEQYQSATNYWGLVFGSANITFQVLSAGSPIVVISHAWQPTLNTWYHIAVVKDGANGYMLFVDGNQIGTTQTDADTIPDFAGPLYVGRHGSNYFDGWIDELRISKGVARWTGNFTPPAAEYLPPDYDATNTAVAATLTYWANQTATANAATATYWANQTATQEAANATATYWANATGTAAWLTANPPTPTDTATPNLTATFIAGQTSTAAMLTAAYYIGTPAYVSEMSYADMAAVNAMAVAICPVALFAVAWLLLRLRPAGKKSKEGQR